MNVIENAKRIFETEIQALQMVQETLGESFTEILSVITECKGKVIMTGMGKSGHIGRKISATLSSLGTPSFFLHPADGLHGDLGMITKDDIVFIISFSGESEEIVSLLPNIKLIGATIIGLSGNKNSSIIKHCDHFQILPPLNEACSLGLAPTSSTTVALVYGDALAVIASQKYGFTPEHFGMFHPAGTLGKKILITIADLMYKDEENATVFSGSTLKSAVVMMSKHGYGMVSIVNKNYDILGIITDGDIRRLLEKNVDIYTLNVNVVMTTTPTLLKEESLAVEALRVLKNRRVSIAPVVNSDNKLVGALSLQKILDSGIVL